VLLIVKEEIGQVLRTTLAYRKEIFFSNFAGLLFLMLLIIVSMSVSSSSVAAASRHHHHKNPKCIQLWVYTEPVQKGPCVVFHHSNTAFATTTNNTVFGTTAYSKSREGDSSSGCSVHIQKACAHAGGKH
jgi:hypothetical protein